MNNLTILTNGHSDLSAFSKFNLKVSTDSEKFSDAIEKYDLVLDSRESCESTQYDWFYYPEQSDLAVFFKKGNLKAQELRRYFISPVSFLGGGVGEKECFSSVSIDKLKATKICIYDSLIGNGIISYVNKNARSIYVGKRCGKHSKKQKEISEIILDEVRTGEIVSRLKGGDPTVFSRITEEIELLKEYGIPFTITPALSSFQYASIDLGGFLTKRGRDSGFTIMSARDGKAKLPCLKHISTKSLPIVFYMGTGLVDQICDELISNGIDSTTPIAVVYEAGRATSSIDKGTLESYKTYSNPDRKRPGVVIVGQCVNDNHTGLTGPLAGKKIAVFEIENTNSIFKNHIENLSGVYAPLVTKQASLNVAFLDDIKNNDIHFDDSRYVALFFEELKSIGFDLRKLNKLTSGNEFVTTELREYGIIPDSEANSPLIASELFLLGPFSGSSVHAFDTFIVQEDFDLFEYAGLLEKKEIFTTNISLYEQFKTRFNIKHYNSVQSLMNMFVFGE